MRDDVVAIPTQRCPGCKYEMTATAPADVDSGAPPPGPGDYVVCVMCGVALRYGPGMWFHAATEEELGALDLETRAQLVHLRARIVQYRRQLANN